jgi:hypothetical protein
MLAGYDIAARLLSFLIIAAVCMMEILRCAATWSNPLLCRVVPVRYFWGKL